VLRLPPGTVVSIRLGRSSISFRCGSQSGQAGHRRTPVAPRCLRAFLPAWWTVGCCAMSRCSFNPQPTASLGVSIVG